MSLDNSKLPVIHRDYNSIYNSLIDIVPSLTSQWTPDNESDAGVVLIKLMSMIGDMLSYNTDRAYLEAFPDTVTQRKNAYQIFKLTGYKMKWYRSALVECSFTNMGEDSTIYIPRYSKILSKDNTICYTNPDEDIYAISGIDGETDKRQTTVLVEGVPITPDVYADSKVTFKGDRNYQFNLNESWHSIYKYNVTKKSIIDNRIYFNDDNVDENHIKLIDNQGEEWQQVDNIDTADDINKKIFEFVVDEFDKPYIKLIDYWEELNIDRFKLFYIKPSGANGIVNVNVLSRVISDAFILLNGNNPQLKITNKMSVGGYNPETPSIARQEYYKYITTFNTLVTLDDFTNFIKRYNVVGNAISKDINNDFSVYLQSTNKDISTIVNTILDTYNIKSNSLTNLYNLTSNDSFSECISYQYDSGNLVVNVDTEKTLWLDIINNVDDDLLNLLISIATNVYDSIKFENNEFYIGDELLNYNDHIEEIKHISNIYEIVYLQTNITGNELTVETIELFNNIINGLTVYNKNRSIVADMVKLTNTGYKDNSVNIYVTLDETKTTSDYFEIQSVIENDLYNSKVLPLDVNITFDSIDYYEWQVGGTVYLKSPMPYNKTQEILSQINSKLKDVYKFRNMEYNQPVKTAELISNMMSVSPHIHYIDIGDITYTKYDVYTNEKYDITTTDKLEISGEISKVLKHNEVFTENSFNINLANYLTIDDMNGNVIIKPSSFVAIIDNGNYIIKDNGYGSLMCNEDILDSSEIDYKINNTTGEINVKFTLSPNIQIDTNSNIVVKFSKNKLTMIKCGGIDTGHFVIDSESIEV